MGELSRSRARPSLPGGRLGRMLFGKDFIVWMLLALGGALLVGNLMALIRPPVAPRSDDDLQKAPRVRSIVMGTVGLVVAIAALASLIAR